MNSAEEPEVRRLMEKRRRHRAALADVSLERNKQDIKWKGDRHDDTHSPHDWIALIVENVGRAVTWPWDGESFRKQMVRVAALAVAAIEWSDRFWGEGDENK